MGQGRAVETLRTGYDAHVCDLRSQVNFTIDNLKRRERLARSLKEEDTGEADRLLTEQVDRVEHVISTPAMTIEGVIAKLECWVLEEFTGRPDRADEAADRLVLSVLDDVRALALSQSPRGRAALG